MKKIYTILILCLVLIINCGCAKKQEKKDNNSLNIVTSFYPMYIATSNIIDGLDNVSLKCLASPEVGCLHDYQLTVNDMITLEKADIFVINGGGMESFIYKAIDSYPELIVINSSEEILDECEEDEHNHDSEGEHIHSHEQNPHVWVSIDLYIKQIEKIAKELSNYDPSNESIYTSNANIYIEKLRALETKMHLELDKLENKNVVMFHEAFHYFAEDFGLNIAAVIEREPGTSPSARDVAEIIDMVKEMDVNAIFVEPQYLKTAANTISKETKVPIYELDPVVSGNFEKEAYVEIMNKNLEVLMEALK